MHQFQRGGESLACEGWGADIASLARLAKMSTNYQFDARGGRRFL